MTLRSICFLAIAWAAYAETPDNLGAVIGDWKGDSICKIADSPCHNEKVIWHIVKLPEKPGWLAVRGDRLENGKPVVMGTLEFKWDGETQTITSEGAGGVWSLQLSGSRLEGKLVRPDKAMFRHIVLQRAIASDAR